MNIMNSPMGSRVQRTIKTPVHSPAPAPAPTGRSRGNFLGGMGIVDRIRYTPSGCSSCGGR